MFSHGIQKKNTFWGVPVKCATKTIFISPSSPKLVFWEMLNKQSNRKISTSKAWNLHGYPLATIMAKKWSKPTVTKTFESESKILQLTTCEKKFEICIFQVPHSFVCTCHCYEFCSLKDEERPISQWAPRSWLDSCGWEEPVVLMPLK